MNKFIKYNYYLYLLLRLTITLDIISRTKDNLIHLIVFTSLFAIILVNDHLRWKIFNKNTRSLYLSFFLSMVLGFILSINLQGYIDIYFYILLYELILFTDSRLSKAFVLGEIGLFIIMLMIRMTRMMTINDIISSVTITEFLKELIFDLGMLFMGLFFYCFSLYSFKALRKEKRKVEELNKELNLSYNKLKEQSERIEELTISQERNRLAGEIHDSLGHGLVALNMNLDVAEKIVDRDVGKAKELIQKSIGLTKESMDSLRKAVYALKEEKTEGLIKSIKRLIQNMEDTGAVNISLKIEEESEKLPPEYKEIIYSIIQEAITNSINHGKAKEIIIEINIEDEVNLIIKDNGIGCMDLAKGNGLLAIQNRVEGHNGKLQLIYGSSSGFGIHIHLPT